MTISSRVMVLRVGKMGSLEECLQMVGFRSSTDFIHTSTLKISRTQWRDDATSGDCFGLSRTHLNCSWPDEPTSALDVLSGVVYSNLIGAKDRRIQPLIWHVCPLMMSVAKL